MYQMLSRSAIQGFDLIAKLLATASQRTGECRLFSTPTNCPLECRYLLGDAKRDYFEVRNGDGSGNIAFVALRVACRQGVEDSNAHVDVRDSDLSGLPASGMGFLVAGLLHSSRGEAIVKEGTTTYLFNNPAYGSEFGSLSTRFSSRENPRKIKVRPWSLLPSSARLQISSKGLVEAGSVGLEFDKETPLWNGDSHPFLRLRSATCPSLQRLLSPLDEGSECSSSNSTATMRLWPAFTQVCWRSTGGYNGS
ncbi:hypothetical protein FOZ62_006922, partial [Perkinsus olseni]